MVSAIDPTKPADGVNPTKLDFRNNLQAAKDEIEALQAEVVALLAALQLSSGQALFPIIPGDNLPEVAATLRTIIQTMDAAITAAAASGGGGGPITLASIADILSPSDAQRIAFQRPIDGGSFDADFNFTDASHSGRFLTLNTALNPVTMALPAAASINRDDGWLCRVIATSGSNFGAVTGPADALRFQPNRLGANATQTTLFLGQSRASGQRSLFDIFKDGSVYHLVGAGRTTETDDLRINAPGSIPGSALEALSLLAATFPNVFDLGGTKQAGGNRAIIEAIAGNHTFLQANSGKTLEHTGGGAATWNVPALLSGTLVEIDNAVGGDITLNDTGSQTVLGGTTLESGGAGAVKWLTGNRVRFFGTI